MERQRCRHVARDGAGARPSRRGAPAPGEFANVIAVWTNFEFLSGLNGRASTGTQGCCFQAHSPRGPEFSCACGTQAVRQTGVQSRGARPGLNLPPVQLCGALSGRARWIWIWNFDIGCNCGRKTLLASVRVKAVPCDQCASRSWSYEVACRAEQHREVRFRWLLSEVTLGRRTVACALWLRRRGQCRAMSRQRRRGRLNGNGTVGAEERCTNATCSRESCLCRRTQSCCHVVRRPCASPKTQR